jgi:hypothetical protein
MSLHLVQAFSNRAPRGRKHDFKDAERLARRFIAKELILSFVPGEEQRICSNLARMKLQLMRDRVRAPVRIQDRCGVRLRPDGRRTLTRVEHQRH